MAAGNTPNPLPSGGRGPDRTISQDSMTGVSKLVLGKTADYKAESQGKQMVYTEKSFEMGATVFFKSQTWMAEGRIKLSVTCKDPSAKAKKGVPEKFTFHPLRMSARYRVDFEEDKMKVCKLTDDGPETLEKTFALSTDTTRFWLLFQLRCGRICMMSGKELETTSTGINTAERQSGTHGRDDTISRTSLGSTGTGERTRTSSGSSTQQTPPETPIATPAVPRTILESVAPPIPERPREQHGRTSGPLDTFREMKRRLEDEGKRHKHEIERLSQERLTIEKSMTDKVATRTALTEEIHTVNVSINTDSRKLQEITSKIEGSKREYDLIQKELGNK